MYRYIKANGDIFLAIMLLIVGTGILISPWGLFKDETTGALVGALWGSATLLFGNAIHRYNDRRLAEKEIEGRRVKLKILIAAELEHIARSLFAARQKIEEIFSKIVKEGTMFNSNINISLYYPHTLHFFDHLGIDIVIFDNNAVNSLVALRSNLETSKIATERLGPTQGINFSTASNLSLILKSNMQSLCEAFKHIAPNHKFKLSDQPEQLITDILQDQIDRSPLDTLNIKP